MKKAVKALVIGLSITVSFILGIFIYIQSGDGGYRITHLSAVERITDSEGRTPAGSEAKVKVESSTKESWATSAKKNETGIVVGIILLLTAGILLAVGSTDFFERNGILSAASFRWLVVLLIGVGLAMFISVYSSVFSNRYVEVSPETYEQFKNNLSELFKNKGLIR